MIIKNFATGHRRQKAFRDTKPLHIVLRSVGKPGEFTIKSFQRKNSDPACALCRCDPRIAFVRSRQAIVCPLHLGTCLRVEFLRHPQTECRPEIVIRRKFIIESQTFRTFADKTCRQIRFVLCQLRIDHRFPVFFIIRSGKFQSFHHAIPFSFARLASNIL